jgi:hypothetical protein
MTSIKMERRGSLAITAILGLSLSAACTAAEMPISEASAAPAEVAAAAAACGGGANSLRMAEADQSLVRPTLAFEARDDFGDLAVRRLSGPCAPAVEDMLIELVRLADDRVFRITPAGLVPAPEALSAFEAERLEPGQIPQVPNMRFVDADDYIQSEGRFVGIWTDGSTWMVGSFRTSAGGSRVRPLLRSRMPLRSVTFFPSPDTPAGQLWLVQDAGRNELSVITVDWMHERAGLLG